jgi:ribosome-associated toxin RatA of RatAB toxin-antitoxin module
MKRLLALLMFLLPQALAAGEIAVDASRRGAAIVVSAHADLHADVRTAWRVLTDYDRYASFIPDLTVSRVVSRGPGSAVVEQRGEARFLFLSYPLEVRLAVAETPYRSVRSRAIAGNFRELVGRYELEPIGGGLRLVYSGRMVLGDAPPGLLDVFVIRRNVARQFEALVREIDRRAAGAGAEIPKG